MNLDINRKLQAAEITQAIEDLGAGEVAVYCFWNLLVRVLADPRLVGHKRLFLLSLEAAVEARNGFGKGVVTVSEMLDGYTQLVDAMVRLRRAFPTLRVSAAPQSLLTLVQQFEHCLQWKHRREC
ncbi:MAG: hypothetical protein KGS72_19230 [Cyanobacteria bacterium REEB67]|nr:hypothetical protein [Cyanobacteria bacterium REEB67]